MFIEQAYKGLHEWWRFALGVVVVLISWQLIGALPLVAALFAKADIKDVLGGMNDMGVIADLLGNNLFLFCLLLTFAIGLISLFFWVAIVHKQRIKHLTTSRPKVDWKRIMVAFVVWGVFSLILILISIQLDPENYVWNFQTKPFLLLVLIAVVMIPIQTSMEEYFMRGYLMQYLGVLAKNRWLPLLITSVLFGSLHILNPEVEKLGYGIMAYYIGTGFFLGIMTLMDEGLELAIGFHAANNLITALLVTANWTAFQTDSLYKDISDPSLSWTDMLPIFIIFPLLLLVLSKVYGWTNWKDKLFGKVLSKDEFLNSNKGHEQLETPAS